ncbi:NACHT domain-containing protein [Mucilaginibacter sp. OK098]|uniref:NACHT domain-containing protein n=1 Tax=Mucilaginibacter sp. OK098 TaxID=1855297 RepID=UPI00091D88C1|nr:hypothetical protein [Mucilaginibacter sp. OK098]SHN18463.1 hypothetical protein SAMN05216524_106207 [Mucilaginibacter sp. OK098]
MFEKFTKLVEAFLKAAKIPESDSNKIIFLILLIGFVSTLIVQFWKLIKYIFLKRNQRILNRDLHPFYTPSDVYNRTKYYIAPNYQNVSPSEDDEPGRKYIASAKEKLISLFLENVFPLGKVDNKHFLILADSGMGKTAFLINLYVSYKNKWQNPLGIKKYDIKLFPVWHQDTFESIAKISDPPNTILLLDAFDEDIKASKDYKKRLTEIVNKTTKFRFIIITSRTQFFPSQKEEPHETGYFTGGDKGEYKFQKLYLSVFDDKDVDKYLRMRFSVISYDYDRAALVAAKCPNLVVRPMLLSFIDDLIKADHEFTYSYQVYQEMIKYWLIRESKKNGIKQRFGTSQNFKDELYNFSQKLAVNIYINREIRNGLYISSAQDSFTIGSINLTEFDNQYILTDVEIRSKSLLNRNAAGEYKFSHKSILEYFLAREFFKVPDFYLTFDFGGMDTAKIFFEEMYLNQLRSNTKGEFKFASGFSTKIKTQELANLTVHDFESIDYLCIYSADKIEFKFLKHFKNLKRLILFDVYFKNIYMLYQILKNYDIMLNKNKIEKVDWIEEILNLQEFKQLFAIRSYTLKFENEKMQFFSETWLLDPGFFFYVKQFALLVKAKEVHQSAEQDVKKLQRVLETGTEEEKLTFESRHGPIEELILKQNVRDEKLALIETQLELVYKYNNSDRTAFSRFYDWIEKIKLGDKDSLKKIEAFKGFILRAGVLKTILPDCLTDC